MVNDGAMVGREGNGEKKVLWVLWCSLGRINRGVRC